MLMAERAVLRLTGRFYIKKNAPLLKDVLPTESKRIRHFAMSYDLLRRPGAHPGMSSPHI